MSLVLNVGVADIGTEFLHLTVDRLSFLLRAESSLLDGTKARVPNGRVNLDTGLQMTEVKTTISQAYIEWHLLTLPHLLRRPCFKYYRHNVSKFAANIAYFSNLVNIW